MKKTITVLIAIVIVLALCGAVAWLFISGKLVWADSSGKQTASATIVCGPEIIETFNDASYYMMREGSEELTIDTDTLNKLDEDIKAKPGYQDDPSCQTILFLNAVRNRNYEATKSAYEGVDRLHEKNVFANSNIRGNVPLFMYEAEVYSLSPEGMAQEGVGN